MNRSTEFSSDCSLDQASGRVGVHPRSGIQIWANRPNGAGTKNKKAHIWKHVLNCLSRYFFIEVKFKNFFESLKIN